MAHEISQVGGVSEAFYAMKPAWHGLGTVVEDAVSSDEAIRLAHLDWEVRPQAIQTVDGIQINDHVANVRTDIGRVLGIVGTGYEIIQNREAFTFLDGLLQDGIIKYESAGALRGGRVVWVLARMPSVDQIAEGDNVLRYVLFSTSHDGSMAIHAIPTSVRVVCANTLRLATSGLAGIRHTGNARTNLEIAKRYLSQFDEKFTLFRDEARLLATRKYTADQAKAYITELFPEVEEAGRSKTIRENKVDAVRAALRSDRQRIPSIKDTWWSLANAVTESVDHYTPKSVKNPFAQERRERNMLSVMDGAGADFKNKAYSLAVQMSA